MTSEPARCPVCGHANLGEYAVLPGPYAVVACRACRLQFLHPQPDEATLAGIYSAHYFLGEHTPDGEAARDVLKARTAQLYLDLLETEGVRPGARLLEIGCGTGHLLAEAQRRGLDVAGIEVSPHAVRTANQRLGAEAVTCGVIEDQALPENSLDVCVLADVIEHARDPLATLRCVHACLKPGGLVFIVTPSLDNWTARLLGPRWLEYKTEHLYYFGGRSIQLALEMAGFETVRASLNHKVLTLSYIAAHFERFRVPVITPVVLGLRRLLPRWLQSKPLRLPASGMTVTARKTRR